MIIQINDSITVETEVPLLEIHEFHFSWKLNQHAVLTLKGLLNSDAVFQPDKLYESKSTINQRNQDGGGTIFCGNLTDIKVTAAGNVKKVTLELTSGTIKLDYKKASRSFQNVEKTYEKVVREVVESEGARVICTVGKGAGIERPVIRYQETVWEFIKRLASHLGTYIMPDVVTGNPNFWFGIRKSEEISPFSQEEYQVHIKRNGSGSGEKYVEYEVQSKEYHKLGDTVTFWGQPVIICEVQGVYRRGELIFTYCLSKEVVSPMIYQTQFVGMELLGTVKEISGEKLKIALDIDGGITEESYFYEWYPETGNGMYAMPEKGTKVFLTFGSADERDGFAGYCLPMDEGKLNYKNRSFMTQEENMVLLNEAGVSMNGKQKHRFLLSDRSISLTTTEKLRIRAGEDVKLQADDIYIRTLDVVEIHQG